MRWIFGLFVFLGLGGVSYMVLSGPSDADHALATSRETLIAFSDPPGEGMLDGLRFDTTMGLQGKSPDLKDFLQFSDGLFMSKECTDRCNYPPSAYLTRQVDGGTDFLVEAFCPTKDTTMVWRGKVRGSHVSGTVTWTASRWYWQVTQVLEFDGALSDIPANMSAGG